MAKILLISCNTACEPYPVYPLGLAMVAEATRRAGHEVVVWDPLAEGLPLRAATEVARRDRPDVIGLSLRNIDNTDSTNLTAYTDACRDLVEKLRTVSDVPIVLGGAGFSLCPEPILRLTGADYGIIGEGERAFRQLVDELARGGAPARGIVAPAEPLRGEEITSPAREEGLASYYLQNGGMLNLQSRRGCAHRCVYCSYPLLEGRAARPRPASAVVDEMELLRDRYQANYLSFTDSVFNNDDGSHLRIAEEIVRRGLKIPWMAFFRPARFTSAEAGLLARAGLACVEWGTDGATDATLDGLGKDFAWGDVEHANRVFGDAGIRGCHFFIFGGPGETGQTLREGLANIGRLDGCLALAYCGIRILPGTAIARRAVAEGQIDPADDLLEAKFYFSPKVDRDHVHDTLTGAFAERPDRIYPPGRDGDKVHAFHHLGRRGPIWDLLLGSRATRRRDK